MAESVNPYRYVRLEGDLPITARLDPVCDPSFSAPDEDHTLTIAVEGEIICAIQNDGSVYLPDPERVEEAAALFWRAVEEMATLRGWTVRRSL